MVDWVGVVVTRHVPLAPQGASVPRARDQVLTGRIWIHGSRSFCLFDVAHHGDWDSPDGNLPHRRARLRIFRRTGMVVTGDGSWCLSDLYLCPLGGQRFGDQKMAVTDQNHHQTRWTRNGIRGPASAIAQSWICNQPAVRIIHGSYAVFSCGYGPRLHSFCDTRHLDRKQRFARITRSSHSLYSTFHRSPAGHLVGF